MSDKGDVTKIESVGGEPQKMTFGQKYKAHMRKWWWAHLIFFIACTLIITLCLVYVGFPNIAQDNVSDSSLTIESQVVSNATPDSVHLHIESTSHSDSMYHPTLDAFNASLSLATSDSSDSAQAPFGMITIPDSSAGDAVPVTIDQTMQIMDMDAFKKYNIAVLKSETFHMYVSGDMTLHEGALPATTVNYDKIVTMKGLNSLKGFNITSTHINPTSGKVTGSVYIPNPSVLTIEMGDAYLDLYVDGKNIGYSIIHNLTLKPGGNTFDMTGKTYVLKSLGVLQKYATKKYDYTMPIDIKGNRAMINGKEIPYYSAAIRSNEMHTMLDLRKAIPSLYGHVGGGGGGGGGGL